MSALPDLGSPCVIHGGRVNEHGYGRVSLGDGGQAYAHRLAWAAVHGTIPDGLTLDHVCCEPRCVNVTHLEMVSLAENVRRSSARLTECPAGHPYDEQNTRRYVSRDGSVGRKCRTCHREWERARKARLR
jgi:hypothetical protein